MQIQQYLKDRLIDLSYVESTGTAYGSISLAADLAGLSEGGAGLGRSLKKHSDLKGSKLAKYLMAQGFKGSDLIQKLGVPADVITEIVAFYADKELCGDYFVTIQAPKSMRMLAQIGLTVAIKQAIGVTVDDRPPAVSADVAAMMQMFMQQQTQIAAQSVQIQQLLAAQTPQQTVKQQVVKRTGVAAEVQSLRCESAQIWARDGQRDPDGAKRRMALIDAEAEELLVNAGVEGGYIHRVKGGDRVIGTGTYYRAAEIFRVMPLAEEDKVGPFDVVPLSRNRNPRLGTAERVTMQVAFDQCMVGFNADLLHGGFLYHTLFTDAAIAHFKTSKYNPQLIMGHMLGQCGFGRLTQHNRKGEKDCPPGSRTYSVYGRCSVYPEARRQVKRNKRDNGGASNG